MENAGKCMRCNRAPGYSWLLEEKRWRSGCKTGTAEDAIGFSRAAAGGIATMQGLEGDNPTVPAENLCNMVIMKERRSSSES